MTLNRVSSGVPDLDLIMGGGFPASSFSLVSGPPGAGKTILAQQIIYNGASEEHPALYFTTVTEPLDKVIAHVQPLDFFRREAPGRYLHYVPLGETLMVTGLAGAMEAIKTEVTRVFPSYVVIDSFRALRDLATDAHDLPRFLYGMANTLGSLRCATLLLDESPVEELMASPVAAVADVIIHMGNNGLGRSNRRALQVLKLRGSGYLQGSHFFNISPAGIRIYPRLGSLVPENGSPAGGFCSSGVKGLDGHLGGGFDRGSMCLVTGGMGTGKTVFSLGFVVAGALCGEPGVFVSLQESPQRLRQMGAGFGWDIAALEQKGSLCIHHAAPLDLEVDYLGHCLLEHVRALGAKRVVIDAITDLETGVIQEDDYQSFLYAIGRILESLGVTTIFTATSEATGDPVTARCQIGRLADALVHLDLRFNQDAVSRHMQLVKTRAGLHGAALLPMSIEDGKGLVVCHDEQGGLPR